MKKNKLALFGNKYVNVREGALYLGDFKVDSLLKKYDTPLFIFIREKIKDNVNKINKCFKEIFPNSSGFYSTKSNFLPEVINIIQDEQFGAEIIGLPELYLLEKLKFSMDKVIAGGPYLPDEFIQEIIRCKVKYLVIYNLRDFERVQNKIEQFGNFTQEILIRFRSRKYTARHGIDCNEENILKIESILSKCPNLKFKGILLHQGRRLKSNDNYLDHFEEIIATIKLIEKNTSLKIEIINMGGGFPNSDSLKENVLKEILIQIKQKLSNSKIINPIIFYEPGRNIVADAGFCVATIQNIDPGTNTIFLNIGNNYIPKFMKSALRFYNIDRIAENANCATDIMGYIPSDQDILVKNYNFIPNPSIGENVLIANVGAYALTWSTRFPYPKPGIILLEKNNKISIILKNNSDLIPL